jgi:hypothetical protein
MIVWSGFGFVTAIIAIVCLVLGASTGLPAQAEAAAGLLTAAAINFLFVRWVDDPGRGREMIDAQTGQRVYLRRRNSLFFIPVRYWTYILFALAILSLVVQQLPRKTAPQTPSQATALFDRGHV